MPTPDDTTEPQGAVSAAGGSAAARQPRPLDQATPIAEFRRLRRAIAGMLIVVVTLVVARLAFVSGLLRPITIDGPSMAPGLVGKHLRVVCEDCGFPFDCDAEHLPRDARAACPNCGYVDCDLARATPLPADRVIIDRWPLCGRSPQRGQCLVVLDPRDNALAVKRLAALPGETWGIRGGDLYVGDLSAGDRIVRKSLAERKATQILVHDNRYQPRSAALPPRWRPAEAATSPWTSTAAGFRYDGAPAAAAAAAAFDWLEYEHWQCTADLLSRGVRAAVTDNDSYNQGETRRLLHPVRDVWLTCRVEFEKPGRLRLAAVAGKGRFELELDTAARRAVLTSAGQTLAVQRLPLRPSRQKLQIAFGVCDQQVFFHLSGREALTYAFEPAAAGGAVVLRPLAIGASGGSRLSVTELRVWRDVYYLDPLGLPRDWQANAPLGKGEYAVLGDNQNVSIDSRQWGAIGAPAIIGRVYQMFSHRPRIE